MKTLEMMFGGGANVAELADMIRRFGRGEDKILAHITPEEAAMLKEAGGSGEINPMTGLPEFQEEYDSADCWPLKVNMVKSVLTMIQIQGKR
jgi:hypothetical protein